MDSVSQSAQALRRQWADSPVLRVGTWAIVGVLWLNALWWHQDQMAAQAKELAALDTELSRLRSLKAGPLWAVRAKEATAQLEALQSMAWTEANAGLAQAAFQDWLNQSALKAGLQVRELRLSANDGAALRPAKPEVFTQARARLVVDFKPQSLASLLQDMSSSPQSIMVDRLQVRTWMQPPQAELDVRIEILPAQVKP